MNMVNYLVRGDLGGARVEARRLAVLQEFMKRSEDPSQAMVGPGSYLAGFIFEKSGRAQEAMRYYDEALAYGGYRSLEEPIRRLAAKSSYRSPRIRRILGEPEAASTPGPEPAGEKQKIETKADETSPPAQDDSGELLVVVSFGRVPIKVAKRVPIGLALTYASGYMSPYDRQRANRLALQGLVTWVNYPELGRARGTWDVPGFALDGKWQPIEGAIAIDQEAKRAWENVRGAVVASAITRMIARIIAGEAVRRSTDDKILGLLLSLGTQATLTAFDTPDTRSWELLPARMAFGRIRLPAGRHWVDLQARGVRKRVEINLPPRSFQVLNLTTLY
jgi:uncharacterized protein